MDYLQILEKELGDIPARRKAELIHLAEIVTQVRESGQAVRMMFICTHNSRRSHLSQIWAATAARWCGIEGLETFSGGTEATAFNPRAVAAMQRAGFTIDNPGGENPRYQVSVAEEKGAMTCFSKKIDHPENPREGFIAVMTCSAADVACPVVYGAASRVALPYEDPKVADNTPGERAKYDERCRQIAREMLFLFQSVGSAKQNPADQVNLRGH